MVSSNGAGGAVDDFIEGRQGGRDQGTPHTQWDMCGISHSICRREGVASIYLFPVKIFLELVSRNEGASHRYAIQQRCWQDKKNRGVPTKSKSSATRATSELTNSTVIKQSNNSRGTLLLARLLWSILVSSSNMVTLITQEYMTLQSVLRTLQSILSMQALLSLQSLALISHAPHAACRRHPLVWLN